MSAVALGILFYSLDNVEANSNVIKSVTKGSYKSFRYLWKKEGLPIFSLGSLAFISAISRLLIKDVPVIYPNAIEMGATVFAALILYILVFRYKVKLNLEKVFMLAFPIVALALLLLPLSEAWVKYLFFGLSKMVFTLGLMLLMLVCKKLSEDMSVPAVGAYGLFSGTVHLMLLLGYYIPFVRNEGSLDSFDYSIIALMCIYGLSMLLLAGRMRLHKESVSQSDNRDAIDATCELMKKKYSLTTQEMEILKLLAHGRSVPYISEKLFISQNTVRTHTKHMYKKLDVHSRQDCIDAVIINNNDDLDIHNHSVTL